MSLTFRVDMGGYWKLRQKTISMLGSGTARAVKVAGEEAADYARQNHRHTRRTGQLTSKQNLYFDLRQQDARGAWGYLTNRTPYAAYVEYGTRPHMIFPKRPGGVLRFEVDGQIVFARSVRHPGIRPFPFMAPASTFAGVVIIRETNNVTFPLVASLWQ